MCGRVVPYVSRQDLWDVVLSGESVKNSLPQGLGFSLFVCNRSVVNDQRSISVAGCHFVPGYNLVERLIIRDIVYDVAPLGLFSPAYGAFEIAGFFCYISL